MTTVSNQTGILVIGGSAGGLGVLLQILPKLKSMLSFPILTVMHRKAYPDSSMCELFRHYTDNKVYDVEDKTKISNGAIYIAPPDYHVLFEDKETLALDFSEKVHYSRPSIDIAFHSAAELFEERTIGILLSGANADGIEGLQSIAQKKGTVVIQDPETAEVDYMPRQAISRVKADHVLKPKEMADFINGLGS